METRHSLGQRLLTLRNERGLTQKEAAAALKAATKLDITPSKYNKWENDTNSPDYLTIREIANYYEVTIDYLLGNSELRSASNQSIIQALQLNETSIKVLKEQANGLVAASVPPGECKREDLYLWSDALNDLISAKDFIAFVLQFGRRVHPSVDERENFKYLNDLGGEGIPAKEGISTSLQYLLNQMVDQVYNRKQSVKEQ